MGTGKAPRESCPAARLGRAGPPPPPPTLLFHRSRSRRTSWLRVFLLALLCHFSPTFASPNSRAPPAFRPMPQSHQKYSLPEAQRSLRDLFLCIIECREHVLAGQKSRPARACMACQDPAAPRSAAQQSDAQHSTCRLQSTVQASSGCLRCATCSPCPRDCFRGCFLPVLQNVVCLHGSSSSRRPAQQISRTFPCTATVNVPQLLM